jgi:mono/diheme cytochrome c family protein
MRAWQAGVCIAAAVACGACSPPQGPAASGGGGRGAQFYEGNCLACHQRDGRGIPNVYPSLAGSPLVNADPAPLVRWVVRGVRPASMPAGRTVAAMPQYGWLQDADAASLLTHIRSQFGNHAAAVTAADVARALGR